MEPDDDISPAAKVAKTNVWPLGGWETEVRGGRPNLHCRLLDHLIRPQQQRLRNGEPERRRGLEVKQRLESPGAE